MKVELDMARKILGDFRIAPAAALDARVYEKVRDYKERIAARFILIGEQDVDELPGSRFYISRKLDGEHNHLYFEDGRATFVKPGGATLHGLPVLAEAERVLTAAGVKSCIIPGELVVEKPKRGGGFERTRIYDVIKLLGEPKSKKELGYFNFAPFDILEIDGEEPETYDAAYHRLQALFEDSSIRPVETVISSDREAIHRAYEDWVRAGGDEGLMIRSDLPFRYKFKAAHLFDAAVVGYREKEGQISGLLLALVHPDGLLQILGTVSDGLEETGVRAELERRLRGLEINSEYIHVDKYHSSYRMVRPEVVVEINSDDILTRHVDGRPYRKMVLEYLDEHYSTYKPVRNAAFVGLQRNTFVRFRDDKKVDWTDVRTSQVTDLVVIEVEKTADFRREHLPAAKIMLREVYTRADAKSGAFAVRKIVAWKTNKETHDPAYSAFVVHYTDFSPARATPLQRELALTDDPAQVEELAAGFRERCTRQGWGLYSDEVSGKAPAPVATANRVELQPQAGKVTRKTAKKAAKKVAKKADKKTAKTVSKKAGKKVARKDLSARTADQKGGITGKSAKKTAKKTAGKKATAKKAKQQRKTGS